MRNLFFKLLLPVFLFQFILIPAVYGQASFPPKPAADIYVQDHAGILSSATEQTILHMGAELDQKTTAQLAVVTVESLDGMAIADYANDLFRAWGIGAKDKNNGVLLLIAPSERQSRIEVGYGLEGALPDGKTGRIQDEYLIPKFKAGDYDGGVLDTYSVLAGVIADEYKIELSGDNGTDSPAPSSSNSLPPWLTVLIAIGVILFLFLDFKFFGGMITWAILNSLRRGGGGGGRGGGGGGFGGGSSGGGGSSRNW
ncbi:hypothetical protein DCMF_15820 [Candidatus Formimonas warabiya]|uniref:TPM domain-containing protein n=2 Tax=Formimonas warabiya TaxID=1761012 RepID=A0A3G1L1Y3_FORW1|nr:hypothetical protein DCMF_15820 [Candidatus Formimonas warabiya]